MVWTKKRPDIVAKDNREMLNASFRFDRFNLAAPGEQPLIEQHLRCDTEIRPGEADPARKGFRVSEAFSASEQAQLEALLRKAGEYARTLDGYVKG